MTSRRKTIAWLVRIMWIDRYLDGLPLDVNYAEFARRHPALYPTGSRFTARRDFADLEETRAALREYEGKE